MGYGQYTNQTLRRGPEFAPFGGRQGTRDRGYPVADVDVKVGRMTNDQIMADVDDSEVAESKRTAHNEVTRTLHNGVVICRLRETDIVTMWPDGGVRVNTGGWNTLTTRRHIVDFLNRHNFPATLWGNKKAGGNVLRDLRGDSAREIIFREYVTVFADGSWTADSPVWQYDEAINRGDSDAYVQEG